MEDSGSNIGNYELGTRNIRRKTLIDYSEN